MSLSRRSFLAASALAGAAATVGAPRAGAAPPEVVTPAHPDYATLTQRGYNRRFTGRPDRIFLPSGSEEVRVAVETAAGDGAPIAVRAGGHGFADFVDDARNRTVIDLGRLRDVRWDSEYRAFSIDAGAQLGPVTEQLLTRWGVTLPAGICKGVGAGGHFSGGGYGPLSRRFGLVADHLHGVEVVTVDADGRARITVATADGPEPDLWWAHTGGGGGNFGVVTRYLLRSGDGADPARALPTAPCPPRRAPCCTPGCCCRSPPPSRSSASSETTCGSSHPTAPRTIRSPACTRPCTSGRDSRAPPMS